MTSVELMIWSAASGAVALIALLALADLLVSHSIAAAQGFTYICTATVYMLSLSGLLHHLSPFLTMAQLQLVQVVVGPLSSAIGNYWMRDWLGARQRDRLTEIALRGASLTCLVAGTGCLALPVQQQLPASAAICLLDLGLVLWLTTRAALFGDRLAIGIAVGCVIMFPAVFGLSAIAMGHALSTLAQAMVALCTVGCLVTIAAMLWQRNRQQLRARLPEAGHSQFDPVTRLPSGAALVQKIINAQRRRRRTRRDGIVLALMVFETEQLARELGNTGLSEVFVHLSARMHREVGVVNLLGRYYDQCFIALVESMHSPAGIRTLGLRAASAARRPMEIRSVHGETVSVKADISVGIVHLSRENANVEDILHSVEEVAVAARGMASRAAILDPASHRVMAVEHARLGNHWHAMREARQRTGRVAPRAGRA